MSNIEDKIDAYLMERPEVDKAITEIVTIVQAICQNWLWVLVTIGAFAFL